MLLGLLEDGSGVATPILTNLGIDLLQLRSEVEKLMLSSPDACETHNLPQTPRVNRVIEYAEEEAKKLDHNYVGTEHILLGLLRDDEGVAAQVLKAHGLVVESVRNEIKSTFEEMARAYKMSTNPPESEQSS